MREIHRRIVGAALVSADDKVLVVKSDPKNRGAYEEYWVIPGGGIEEGETAEQAVAREVLEETGLDISGYTIERMADHRKGQTEKTLRDTGERVLVHMDFVEFRIRLNDQQSDSIPVQLSHEHSHHQWATPEILSTLKLSPPTHGLFKQLGYI